MASLRKRFSRWSLGEQQSPPSKGSPRKLHKALSTTFNYLASTVRQGATYIYHEAQTEDLPQCSDGGSPETLKKHRRRSSFFSSVRSRKGVHSPDRQNDGVEPLERSPFRTGEYIDFAPTVARSHNSSKCPTLVCVTDEPAPTLDVRIPDSSWPADTVIGLESSPVTRQWALSPCLIMEDPFTGQDDLTAQVRNLIPSAPPQPTAQYVENTGYVAEGESGAESSGTEGFAPACLKRVRSKEQSVFPVAIPHRGSSAISLKPVGRLNMGTIQPQISQDNGRLPSDIYEADAELSETSSELTPSMGSRTTFEHGLASRSRRYLAVIEQYTAQSDTMDRHRSCSSIPSLHLTNNEIMALGANASEGKDVRGLSSNSKTDVSNSSPLKHTTILTQDDPYCAGMRAAGILCRPCARQQTPTMPERVELELSNGKTKPKVSTLVSHSSSDLSNVTNDSCAVARSSLSYDAPPPYPILHVRSERVGADISALIATEMGDKSIAGPADIGLYPPSPAAAGDEVPTDTPKSEHSSPRRAFIAARLPSFGSPSMGSSPKSKRSLRQQKRANRKAAVTKHVANDTMKSASPGQLASQPVFCVNHFEANNGDPPPYAGHELDAVHNMPQPKSACPPPVRETKGVSFTENEEIIGHSVRVRRLSPASGPL